MRGSSCDCPQKMGYILDFLASKYRGMIHKFYHKFCISRGLFLIWVSFCQQILSWDMLFLTLRMRNHLIIGQKFNCYARNLKGVSTLLVLFLITL